VVTIVVRGEPASQGSKRAFRNPHSGRISQVESSKALKPWREHVHNAAVDAMAGAARLEGPVSVRVVFYFDRPATHYRSGRNAHLLREGAPIAPANRGSKDIDKLQRAVFDALSSAGVWADDSQVAIVVASKAWTTDGGAALTVPGVVIAVHRLGGE
jgi:Holliday junction resolvase RusA-like endonuclease